MIHGEAPRSKDSPSLRGAPILITAELPPDIFAWADGLRRRHYPPERNRLGAHVTLFHGLPPSAEPAVRAVLGDLSRQSPPEAHISGIMDLGRGTAFSVGSPALADMHGEMAKRLHGLIQQKDARPLKLHITVQNKVSREQACALQAQLADDLQPIRFRFRGLALSHWRGELWQMVQLYRFRGQG